MVVAMTAGDTGDVLDVLPPVGATCANINTPTTASLIMASPEFGQKTARPVHVLAIRFAETRDQPVLLSTRAKHDESERHQAAGEQKPICRNQRVRKNRQKHRIIKRVPHPAIRALGDERVLASRNLRFVDILLDRFRFCARTVTFENFPILPDEEFREVPQDGLSSEEPLLRCLQMSV